MRTNCRSNPGRRANNGLTDEEFYWFEGSYGEGDDKRLTSATVGDKKCLKLGFLEVVRHQGTDFLTATDAGIAVMRLGNGQVARHKPIRSNPGDWYKDAMAVVGHGGSHDRASRKEGRSTRKAKAPRQATYERWQTGQSIKELERQVGIEGPRGPAGRQLLAAQKAFDAQTDAAYAKMQGRSADKPRTARKPDYAASEARADKRRDDYAAGKTRTSRSTRKPDYAASEARADKRRDDYAAGKTRTSSKARYSREDYLNGMTSQGEYVAPRTAKKRAPRTSDRPARAERSRQEPRTPRRRR